MNPLELLTSLLSQINDFVLFLPTIPLLIILVFFLLNPEKVERWSALLASLVSFLSTRAEKVSVARDIQGRIKEFRSSFCPEAETILPYDVKIRWVNKTEPDAYLREGEVVVVMGEHSNQARNFLTALLTYLPKGLIPTARPYVPPKTMRAIELIIARKIVYEKRLDAVEIFEKEVLDKELKTDNELYETARVFFDMDERGLFAMVFLREISESGNRLYPSLPDESYFEPVNELVRRLEDLVTKPVGEPAKDHIAVNSENLNMCVVLVAKPETLPLLVLMHT